MPDGIGTVRARNAGSFWQSEMGNIVLVSLFRFRRLRPGLAWLVGVLQQLLSDADECDWAVRIDVCVERIGRDAKRLPGSP